MPLPLLLVIGLIGVPALEIWVIVQVGHAIGAWPTVALLLLESLLGAWLIRREGRRTWRALREKLDTSALPSKELLDSGLVMIGGILLLVPGFVTDALGFALVLPFTQPLVRRLAAFLLLRRLGASGLAGGLLGAGLPGMSARRRGGDFLDSGGHVVVEGEVLEGEGNTKPPGPGVIGGPAAR